MQGQRNLISKTGIGIRVVGNIEPKIFIGRHHRQRLVMDISSYPAFCHRLDDFIALLGRYMRHAANIQVARRGIIVAIVRKRFYAERGEIAIV